MRHKNRYIYWFVGICRDSGAPSNFLVNNFLPNLMLDLRVWGVVGVACSAMGLDWAGWGWVAFSENFFLPCFRNFFFTGPWFWISGWCTSYWREGITWYFFCMIWVLLTQFEWRKDQILFWPEKRRGSHFFWRKNDKVGIFSTGKMKGQRLFSWRKHAPIFF